MFEEEELRMIAAYCQEMKEVVEMLVVVETLEVVTYCPVPYSLVVV